MLSENSLELGVVGNCSWGGLIDSLGRVVWACFPHFDGDPVFSSLLNGSRASVTDGFYEIEVQELARSEQFYAANSAVLVTRLWDEAGNGLEIRDFAPRFAQFRRMFRPTMFVRTVTPIHGSPRIRIRLRPMCNYGAEIPTRTHGSNHIRYVGHSFTLRLTTDGPVTYILNEVDFVLEQAIHLVLGPDESLMSALSITVREFEERTLDYWNEWARTLSIPFEWQDAVIRAAITLKLLSFEETGAVIAALTTSIPEAPDTERNWDYRYCWPRDAYFVIHALNRLGATRTLEGYLSYLTNIAARSADSVQPVYGIDLTARLTERIEPHLAGYLGHAPVRVGNQAHEHRQNDVYGALILAATQAFFDRRLLNPGETELYGRLERLGEHALRSWNVPDAGLWELRNRSHVHTFSAVMCWAACDRLAKIGVRLGLRERADFWRREADRIHSAICDEAWNEERRCFVDQFGGSQVDASLLLLAELGFVPASDPRFAGTVAAIEQDLRCGRYLYRYATPDDFGRPTTAFTICTFWYIDALAAMGRRKEARELFEQMLERRTPLGLLSEDLDPESGVLWGNFPQTYSMVGLINCAMRLSRSWEEAF